MIDTERLILRPWRAEDRAPFLTICRSEAVMACLGGPSTEAEVDAALGRVRASQDRNGFCFWALERRADSALLGFCGLKVADTPGTPVEDDPDDDQPRAGVELDTYL